MLDKLQNLIELQAIDKQLQSIKRRLEGLPEIVEDLKFDIKEKSKELDKRKKYVEEAIQRKKDLLTSIEDHETAIEKYKKRRSSVTSNKEYEALVKEMGFSEEQILKDKDNLEIVESEILEGEERVSKVVHSLDDLSDELKKGEGQLSIKLSESEKESNELVEKRKNIVALIPGDLYNLYSKILASKNQLAVVGSNKGYCEGCFTVLPAQKISELKRQNSIVICESCNRILSYDKDIE